MRFRKSIKCKRSNRLNDLLLRFTANSVARHAGAQLFFDHFHSRLRTFEAHGAAQLLRLAARKVGGDHGHAQQLLLKQRYAQGTAEHRFERRMRICDRLSTLPPLEKWIDHIPHDRSRSYDRHLHHDVVKSLRLQVR